MYLSVIIIIIIIVIIIIIIIIIRLLSLLYTLVAFSYHIRHFLICINQYKFVLIA